MVVIVMCPRNFGRIVYILLGVVSIAAYPTHEQNVYIASIRLFHPRCFAFSKHFQFKATACFVFVKNNKASSDNSVDETVACGSIQS